jgi:hypothetical protein
MIDENSTMRGLQSPFSLFALRDRILAQNPDGKLIDIGALTTHEDGYAARLDVGGISIPAQRSAQEALAALGPLLSFDYLDGLFTSVAPAEPHTPLAGCPSMRLTFDEPLPR